MKMVLEGIRVLDLSQFFSGPWCGALLADMGAEVIKVEPPPIGDFLRVGNMFEKGLYPLFYLVNRNKKSITLNLKRSEEAREIFCKLVEKSDVIIDNSLPGDMEKIGLGYDDLKKINPKLIYASISGFGRSGLPNYVKRPAFDIIAQATSGILDAQKMYEAPRIPFSDFNAGGYCALGIMQALFYRERTGKGQLVDLSMQDLMYSYNILTHISQTLKEKIETSFARLLPSYNVFPAEDGYVALVCITEKQWVRLCQIMERPELARNRRYNSPLKRWERSAEVDEIIEEWTKTKDVEAIVKLLEEGRVPCGPVEKFGNVMNHPQLAARGMVKEYELPKIEGKIKLPDIFIKLSESPGRIKDIGPKLGEHTDQVLSKILGLSNEEIAQLRKDSAI